MVHAAFETPSAANRVYLVQGRELISTREAARRYAAARPERIRLLSVPAWILRSLGLASEQVAYFMALFDATAECFASIDAEREENNLPDPVMTVEAYARSIDETGDHPRK
jgi:hypothetical protein